MWAKSWKGIKRVLIPFFGQSDGHFWPYRFAVTARYRAWLAVSPAEIRFDPPLATNQGALRGTLTRGSGSPAAKAVPGRRLFTALAAAGAIYL
jgi:hypothetical protein